MGDISDGKQLFVSGAVTIYMECLGCEIRVYPAKSADFLGSFAVGGGKSSGQDSFSYFQFRSFDNSDSDCLRPRAYPFRDGGADDGNPVTCFLVFAYFFHRGRIDEGRYTGGIFEASLMEIHRSHSPQERRDHKFFGPVCGKDARYGCPFQQDDPGKPEEESLPPARTDQEVR